MLRPVTKEYLDYSTLYSFSFGFRCDRCGNIWKSEVIPFSTEEFAEPLDEKLRSLLWTKQYEDAYERANTEAIFHFNHCPRCKRWVCNDCFFIDRGECTDICIDCNKD